MHIVTSKYKQNEHAGTKKINLIVDMVSFTVLQSFNEPQNNLSSKPVGVNWSGS